MCTLAAVVGASPDVPLVVFANRDEVTARPATPPFLWPGAPRVVSPRDDLAGGTWLGLNEHALFVGITNRFGVRPDHDGAASGPKPRAGGAGPDPAKRSRGALVADALRAPSAKELHARLADLDPAAHNPFHLLYADRASAHLTWSDGHALHRADLAPGLFVVTERSFGAGPDDRGALVRRLHDELRGDLSPGALGALLSRHADDPFAATCVHADAFGYGTRSSMILTLGESWSRTRMLWAEGRPCVTPYVEQAELIAALAS
jgi:hypothetical protein